MDTFTLCRVGRQDFSCQVHFNPDFITISMVTSPSCGALCHLAIPFLKRLQNILKVRISKLIARC